MRRQQARGTPRNNAGKTGPPLKLASEIIQASPLHAVTSASAPTDHVSASDTSPGSATSPEKSTSLTE